jgi:serine/threonine protein phosphatase PrpC
MARSFGDKVAHSVGVSAEPEIKEFILNENDKFVIIASDGLWDFL